MERKHIVTVTVEKKIISLYGFRSVRLAANDFFLFHLFLIKLLFN